MDIFKRKILRDQFVKTVNDHYQLFEKLNKLGKQVSKLTPDNVKYMEDRGKQFDHLITMLRSEKTLVVTKKVLDKYYRFYKPDPRIILVKTNPRIFLSAWTFVGFPEFTLECTKSDLEKQEDTPGKAMYTLAKRLINNFMMIICKNNLTKEDFYEFNKSMNMYNNCFMMFINMDRIAKIEELLKAWCSTEKTVNLMKNSPEKYSKIQQIRVKEQRSELKDLIKKIDPNFDMSFLDTYYSLSERFEQQYKKAYWDKLSEDMRNKEHEFLGKILDEIQTETMKMVPNNHKFHEEFKQQFDVDFIKSMVSNNALDGELFMKYANYLVDTMKSLQAQAKTQETQERWEKICQSFTAEESNTWDKIVPNTLRFVLELIQNTKEDIVNFHTMMNLGINPLMVSS